MSAARDLLNEARMIGVSVYLTKGTVGISWNEKPSDAFIQRLRDFKQDIIEELSSAPRNPPPGYVHRICSKCGTFPAPFGVGVFHVSGQEGQWFCGSCRPMEGK